MANGVKDADAPSPPGPESGAPGAAGAGRSRDRFSPGEWAEIAAWPWVMAGAAAFSDPAALAGAGAAFLALVAAPLVRDALAQAGLEGRASRTARAAVLAALTGAISCPALAAVALSGLAPPGTIPSGAVLLALAAYALFQAAAVAGPAYPAAVVLWLGAPPLLWYLLTDLLSTRWDGLLALGAASGPAWALSGPGTAYGRLLGPAAVLALAGGALSLRRSHHRDTESGGLQGLSSSAFSAPL